MLAQSLMVGIRAEINRTLLSSPYSRNIIIISDRKFTTSNDMFSGKCKLFYKTNNPVGNHMFKVNNKNTRTRCKKCSKLTIKTPERRRVFIVNLEHISHLVLVFLLLTLSR